MTWLLVIIYIAFISLGLPDAVLGSAWPVMQLDLAVPVSSAGIVSMLITGGTILSSFFSYKLITKFGTGKVTAVSVFMTAVALLGMSIVPSFLWLCLLAIPLGLGAGSVDAALNNFVALHYKAKHMSWLHCFWGIGATLGPILMSYYLLEPQGWKQGFGVLGMIQISLVFMLFATLPLWKKSQTEKTEQQEEKAKTITFWEIMKINGVKSALLGFFCYCALEATTGLWGSSFLVVSKNVDAETAAQWGALFYLGITLGRFISGFAAIKFSSKKMIVMGQCLIGVGVAILILSSSTVLLPLGLFCIGLGCAPVYPCMLHQTPLYFGSGVSQAIMGVQMACAYVGAAIMPPLFGMIGQYIDMALYPFYLFVLLILLVLSTEITKRKINLQNTTFSQKKSKKGIDIVE